MRHLVIGAVFGLSTTIAVIAFVSMPAAIGLVASVGLFLAWSEVQAWRWGEGRYHDSWLKRIEQIPWDD